MARGVLESMDLSGLGVIDHKVGKGAADINSNSHRYSSDTWVIIILDQLAARDY